MSPLKGHAQGPGASCPWRELRAGPWRTDASPGSRQREATDLTLRGGRSRVRGPASPAGRFSFRGRGGCASESEDSGFRRPGPVCRQCRRLSSLCLSASLLALGDAVHLLWVVLGRVSTPRDVAKGSRVLPAERCLPCLLRKPWPPPAMRQEAGRAGGRRAASSVAAGDVWPWLSHTPDQLCGPSCPSPCLGLLTGVVSCGAGGEQTAGGHSVRAMSPCPVERLQPSAFLLFCHLVAWGRASRHLGRLSVAAGSRSVQDSFSFESVFLCLRHSSGTVEPPASLCPLWAAPGHLERPGLVTGLEALSRGIGVITSHLTALEAEAPRA